MPASFPFPYPGTLCRQPKRARHFVHQFRERQAQYALARIENHVHRAVTRLWRHSHCLAHASLDPVALDRSAQHFAHCKSHTRSTSCFRTVAQQIKHRYISGELPTPILVDPLKVGVLQQTPRFRKLASCGYVLSHSAHDADSPVSPVAAAESCGGSQGSSGNAAITQRSGLIGLFAVAGLYGNALTPLGAPA